MEMFHGNVSFTCVGGRFSNGLAFLVKSSLRVALTECWRLDLSYMTTVSLSKFWKCSEEKLQMGSHVYEEKT